MKYLRILLQVSPDPVNGQLDLRTTAQRIEWLPQRVNIIGPPTWQLQVQK